MKRLREVAASEAIDTLAQKIDSFKKYSYPHSRQIADLAGALARSLGLLHADVAAIVEAAMLHDLGLYSLAPDYISSPGELNELQQMDLRRHPVVGEQEMSKRGASRHTQLLVRWHHEGWNGAGYPDGLAFHDIPIGSRILRAVELYCALGRPRPYRPALFPAETLDILRSSAGVECDPDVVAALLALVSGESAANPAVAAPSTLYGTSQALSRLEDRDAGPPSAIAAATSEPLDGTAAQSGAAPGSNHAEKGLHQDAALPSSPDQTAADPPPVGAEFSPAEGPPASPSQARPPAPISLSAPPRLVKRVWESTSCISDSLLGFEISVLHQIPFRSIALPVCAGGRLVSFCSYLGKQVIANDPRAWACISARSAIRGGAPISEEQIEFLLEDNYVPRTRLMNAALRDWFSEVDAWWLDNLRCKAGRIEDEALRDRVFVLGIRCADYARSFRQSASELKRSLTSVFRELAAKKEILRAGHPYSESHNLAIDTFTRAARADLLFLNLPPAQAEAPASVERSKWRESWILGAAPQSDGLASLTREPQSKTGYLEQVDKLLAGASAIGKWAVECRDIGLASARDITDLIRSHRPIETTYSKDLSEVAGGHRNYIIVAARD